MTQGVTTEKTKKVEDTGDTRRQQTCLNTVEIIISFDIQSKPIKLKKSIFHQQEGGGI